MIFFSDNIIGVCVYTYARKHFSSIFYMSGNIPGTLKLMSIQCSQQIYEGGTLSLPPFNG